MIIAMHDTEEKQREEPWNKESYAREPILGENLEIKRERESRDLEL